jgi:2,3-dihydro-2,3-dihydroxybenzoate dehydrogenase
MGSGTAWVVGTGGIGAAFVASLASHRVVAFDRHDPAAFDPAYRVDVTDRAALIDAMGAAVEAHGSPELMVVAAGTVSYATVEEAGPSEVARILADNLTGMINVLHVAFQLGESRPRGIVIVTSNAADVARPQQPIYAACKAATNSLVRSLAVGWSDYGVRIVAVAPGTVVVDRNRDRVAHRYPDAPNDPTRPGGRLLLPAELAGLVVGLLPHLDHMTGQVITVDGGSSLTAAR